MLIDTCVVIDHFRGNSEATRFLLDNRRKLTISAVTDMEISQGVRNKKELAIYESLLQSLSIRIIDLDAYISVKARLWVRNYGLSHGLYLADALIAATAVTHNLTLVTFNLKDFTYLGIKLDSIL